MTALYKLRHRRAAKNDIVMPLDGREGKYDVGEPLGRDGLSHMILTRETAFISESYFPHRCDVSARGCF